MVIQQQHVTAGIWLQPLIFVVVGGGIWIS
jgi:cytochrome c-type biogenesis protein CcmH/NrfF